MGHGSNPIKEIGHIATHPVEAIKGTMHKAQEVKHNIINEAEGLADKTGLTKLGSDLGDKAAKVMAMGNTDLADKIKGYADDTRQLSMGEDPTGITSGIENTWHGIEHRMKHGKGTGEEEAPVSIEDPQAPLLHSTAQDAYNEGVTQGQFGKGTSDRYGVISGENFGKLARNLRG